MRGALLSGLVAGGQHDENRRAQPAVAGSRMGATENSMTEAKKKPDCADLRQTEGVQLLERAVKRVDESSIVNLFRVGAMSALASEIVSEIPFQPSVDAVIYEMQLKHGRADIVIFHVDGTASVIEVKDGSHGLTHVLAGIGQATAYAVQVGAVHGAVRRVRRCLLWTSTGELAQDALVEDACKEAGVVPMSWGSLRSHLSPVQKYLDELERGASGAA